LRKKSEALIAFSTIINGDLKTEDRLRIKPYIYLVLWTASTVARSRFSEINSDKIRSPPSLKLRFSKKATEGEGGAGGSTFGDPLASVLKITNKLPAAQGSFAYSQSF
jgi:hypothetical protein